MDEWFKNFEVLKILLWVVPGAFIALFRSFAMRGTFPGIGKDDFAAFVLGSIVYYFLLILVTAKFGPAGLVDLQLSQGGWFLLLMVCPAIAGTLLGLLEASDAIGRALRKVGIGLPSPHATAWETMFRELAPGAVLLVTLKDGTMILGRWVSGKGGSASSSDIKTMDLYLAQIGTISRGRYVPEQPARGAYIAANEIRYIEVFASQF